MKYLKMLGWIGLYLLVYLLSSVAGGMLLGIVYFVRSILSGHPLPFDSFVAENMTILLVISGIMILGFGFVILLLRGHKPFRYLEFKSLSAGHTVLMAVMGAGFALFVNSLMTLIEVEKFLPDYVTDPLVEMMNANLFLTFLAIGVIVPIYEEVLVRGLMFKELKSNMKIWPALLLQGLIFGLMHGNVLQFSYAFPMGVLLGYIFVKYRSIWAPILIHLVWNSTSLLMGAFIPATDNPWVFVLIMVGGGVLFLGGVIYTIRIRPVAPPPDVIPPEPV